MERIAIVGGPKWTDRHAVEMLVKSLPANTVVFVDEDPWTVQASTLRQCRCSHLVAFVARLPGGATQAAVQARRKRDAALYGLVQRVIVFGEMTEDREATLRQYEANGLPVERTRE